MVVVEASWRLNRPVTNLLISRSLSLLETSSAAAFAASAFAIAASAAFFFSCASFALLVRSSSDPVVPSVEPVGVDPVCPVGPANVDPVDPVGPPNVDPVDPPETGDVGGVLEPVKKGEVAASQTTVAPSSVDFWTKQYSSLSLR